MEKPPPATVRKLCQCPSPLPLALALARSFSLLLDQRLPGPVAQVLLINPRNLRTTTKDPRSVRDRIDSDKKPSLPHGVCSLTILPSTITTNQVILWVNLVTPLLNSTFGSHHPPPLILTGVLMYLELSTTLLRYPSSFINLNHPNQRAEFMSSSPATRFYLASPH